MDIRIHVEQAHIDNGEPQNGLACALALALYDHYPHATTVSVGMDYAIVYTDDNFGLGQRINLPDEAETFIVHLDAGKPVYPVCFIAELVAPD